MATKETIQALLDRVLAARGPDAQLDRDITIDMRDWSGFLQTPTRDIREKMIAYTGTAERPTVSYAGWQEPLTGSLDAVKAMIDREFPGSRHASGKMWSGHCFASVSQAKGARGATDHDIDHSTSEALALCAGMLALKIEALAAAAST